MMENEDKVTKYETFLNDTLRADLKVLVDKRQQVFQQIAEHLELKNTIEALQETGAHQDRLKTKVDLGCNFYCSARVSDPSRIFVLVGFGFFIEMTLPEATSYIDRRVPLLEQKADQLGEQAVQVRAKINLVLEALRELQGLTDLEKRSRSRPIPE